MNGNQIFISHQSNDTKVAIELYDDLLAAGYWVWIDKKIWRLLKNGKRKFLKI